MSQPGRIAITPGEPAGIGPELVTRLLRQPSDHERVVVGDVAPLQARAEALGVALHPYAFDPSEAPQPQQPGEVAVSGPSLAVPAQPGTLDVANAPYVVATLDAAIDGCLDGTFGALVTGPVHKGIINEAGVPFSGHTERLGERSGATPVMLLVADALRVALVTTHVPLRAVPDAITGARIELVATTLARDLEHRFGIASPRIAVLGLNPHAGEGGHLGSEEQAVIEPALERLRAAGIDVRGPLPADTAFTPRHLAEADAVLAMYHDQGLPVLKHAGFGHAVNVTLGLPFLRTSVDHGTALDLAGTGRADPGSLQAAFALAEQLMPSR